MDKSQSCEKWVLGIQQELRGIQTRCATGEIKSLTEGRFAEDKDRLCQTDNNKNDTEDLGNIHISGERSRKY